MKNPYMFAGAGVGLLAFTYIAFRAFHAFPTAPGIFELGVLAMLALVLAGVGAVVGMLAGKLVRAFR